MREFSEFEKKAMKIMATHNSYSIKRNTLGIIVKKLFEKPNFEIKITAHQTKLACGGSTKAFFDVPKELQQITDKLISLQILIEYLESLYLVRLYDNGAKEKSIELTKTYAITAINEIEDEKVNSFYCSRWSNNLCTTEAFEKFVFENKFKTPEQRRFFRRQQIATWIGIAIAFEWSSKYSDKYVNNENHGIL